MTSSACSKREPPSPASDPRFARLSATSVFAGGGLGRWSTATLGVVGGGVIGGRLCVEAVLSGIGTVLVWDSDRIERVNQGNQFGQPGRAKVDAIVQRCDAIRPGHAAGFDCDVRHAGIRQLARCDVLVDASDDARLAWPLTEISNGLGVPLLRAAVDGSGQLEFGRVLCSSCEGGHACQLCSYSMEDLMRVRGPTPCPRPGSRPGGDPEPTRTGGAMGAVIAGIALLQAQRLVTGNDLDCVLDRELIVDLSHLQLLPLKLSRSDACISGHCRWRWIDLDGNAREISLADAFAAARQHHRAGAIRLEVYLLPLNDQAVCPCGAVRPAVGTDRLTPPRCNACGRPMRWLGAVQRPSVDAAFAAEAGVLHQPLARLGVPDGAMLVARAPARPALRMLLR